MTDHLTIKPHFCWKVCVPGVPLVSVLFGKTAYRRTEYRITPLTVEIESGMFLRQKQIVHFSDLDHVLFEQSVMQKRRRIGSLALIVKNGPRAPLALLQRIVDHAMAFAAPRFQDVLEPESVLQALRERRDPPSS